MKIVLSIFFCLVMLTVAGQSADEIKLINTLKEFHQALIKKNTVSINQQTDKALTYGHSNGWVETKNEVMENLETGKTAYRSFKEDSIQVHMNGNMASARFNAVINVALNGVYASYKLKVLEVWVKKTNRWVLFARQAVRDIN